MKQPMQQGKAIDTSKDKEPDLYGMDEEQRQTLARVLQRAEDALDDWINTYASELCDPDRVAEAMVRIYDNGGTLAYVAGVLMEVRAAKKWLSE